jgi:homoserine O-acetyltransferase
MTAPAAARLATAATGAWDPAQGVGDRKFAHLGGLSLESGTVLPDVRIAYETWGTLNAERTNAVLVLHALTGDSHVLGPAGPAHPTAGAVRDPPVRRALLLTAVDGRHVSPG